ncbi:olfactory receptor 11L1-like [Spea bombifrons]|uniref:olfactory receptor 11L1-like n=1 Tax=Spea bombifrons TaxID=233779 RepID=UPI00234AA8EC|nr:olfactory receptor 11L1-like [Spea bombifrons]
MQKMNVENRTEVTEFLLLGFPDLNGFKIHVFLLILILYSMTLVGNALIISVVSTSPQLFSPMYFFLGNLSISDIMLTSNIVPLMLYVIWKESGTISLVCCILQFYIYACAGSAECLLLTVMSYDRYLAICCPLRYSSLMDCRLRLRLVTWSWILSWTIPVISVVMISRLQFCDSNIIDHFFCDLAPLLSIACSDIASVELEALLASTFLFLSPFVFITVTYICISLCILKIPTTNGRHKAFLTCSSHLTVVCMFYGTMISLYMVPTTGHSPAVTKSLSLLYAVVTPFLNPIIYTLRNTEIRTALRKWSKP